MQSNPLSQLFQQCNSFYFKIKDFDELSQQDKNNIKADIIKCPNYKTLDDEQIQQHVDTYNENKDEDDQVDSIQYIDDIIDLINHIVLNYIESGEQDIPSTINSLIQDFDSVSQRPTLPQNRPCYLSEEQFTEAFKTLNEGKKGFYHDNLYKIFETTSQDLQEHPEDYETLNRVFEKIKYAMVGCHYQKPKDKQRWDKFTCIVKLIKPKSQLSIETHLIDDKSMTFVNFPHKQRNVLYNQSINLNNLKESLKDIDLAIHTMSNDASMAIERLSLYCGETNQLSDSSLTQEGIQLQIGSRYKEHTDEGKQAAERIYGLLFGEKSELTNEQVYQHVIAEVILRLYSRFTHQFEDKQACKGKQKIYDYDKFVSYLKRDQAGLWVLLEHYFKGCDLKTLPLKHQNSDNQKKHYTLQVYLFALMCRVNNQKVISREAFEQIYGQTNTFIDCKPLCYLVTYNSERIELFETLCINGLSSICNQKQHTRAAFHKAQETLRSFVNDLTSEQHNTLRTGLGQLYDFIIESLYNITPSKLFKGDDHVLIGDVTFKRIIY